jgi:hypothetical protein
MLHSLADLLSHFRDPNSLVSVPPHKFTRPHYWYYCWQEIKTYKSIKACYGIMLISNFIKIRQKAIWGIDTRTRYFKRFEVLTAVKMSMLSFWASPEDGGSTFFRNVGTYLQDHTSSQPKRPKSTIYFEPIFILK